MNHPLDLSDLPVPGSTRVDLLGDLQTAVGEVARSCRSSDDPHLQESVAALLRIASQLLLTKT